MFIFIFQLKTKSKIYNLSIAEIYNLSITEIYNLPMPKLWCYYIIKISEIL